MKLNKVQIAIGAAFIIGFLKLSTRKGDKEENPYSLYGKYSKDKLESMSDEELAEEREKVRLAFISRDTSEIVATTLQNILYVFDAVMREREDDGTEWTPPAHRENGWYVANDD